MSSNVSIDRLAAIAAAIADVEPVEMDSAYAL